MKIQRIENYPSARKLDCCSPKPKDVSFGFGEDYGPDPSMEPEFNHASKPSTLKSLWLMVEIPAVLIKEAVQDALEEHREMKKYKAMLKEQDRTKQEKEEKPDDDGIDKTIDFDDSNPIVA